MRQKLGVTKYADRRDHVPMGIVDDWCLSHLLLDMHIFHNIIHVALMLAGACIIQVKKLGELQVD